MCMYMHLLRLLPAAAMDYDLQTVVGSGSLVNTVVYIWDGEIFSEECGGTIDYDTIMSYDCSPYDLSCCIRKNSMM